MELASSASKISSVSQVASERPKGSNTIWEMAKSLSGKKSKQIVIDNQSQYTLFAVVTTDPHSQQLVGGNLGVGLGGGNVGVNVGARPVIGALYVVHPESKRPIPVRTKFNYMTILRNANVNNKWFVVRHNREIKRGIEYSLQDAAVEKEKHLTVDKSFFTALGIQLDQQEETPNVLHEPQTPRVPESGDSDEEDAYESERNLLTEALTSLEERANAQDETIRNLNDEVYELKVQFEAFQNMKYELESLIAKNRVSCCDYFRCDYWC